MKPEEFFKSKRFFWAATSVAAVLAMALIFSAGVLVGVEKARFSYRWNDSNFLRATAKNSPGPAFLDSGYLNGHGATGAINKINGADLTILDIGGHEKIITLSGGVTIRQDNSNIAPGGLKVGDHIVVIGSPQDNGSISATLIRVLDDPGHPPAPGLPF